MPVPSCPRKRVTPQRWGASKMSCHQEWQHRDHLQVLAEGTDVGNGQLPVLAQERLDKKPTECQLEAVHDGAWVAIFWGSWVLAKVQIYRNFKHSSPQVIFSWQICHSNWKQTMFRPLSQTGDWGFAHVLLGATVFLSSDICKSSLQWVFGCNKRKLTRKHHAGNTHNNLLTWRLGWKKGVDEWWRSGSLFLGHLMSPEIFMIFFSLNIPRALLSTATCCLLQFREEKFHL